jgi:hypothetical protein
LDDGDVKINLYQLMAIILCVAFIWRKIWIGVTIQSNTGHSVFFLVIFFFGKKTLLNIPFFQKIAKN